MAFKDRYYVFNGAVLKPEMHEGGLLTYVSSKSNVNASGTYADPVSSSEYVKKRWIVLSGGYHEEASIASVVYSEQSVIGQGMFNTHINNYLKGGDDSSHLYDLGLCGNIRFTGALSIHRCCIMSDITFESLRGGPIYFIDSLLYNNMGNNPASFTYTNSSLVNCSEVLLSKFLTSGNMIFDNCDIRVSALGYGTSYGNFSNCKFKFRDEDEAKPLIGNTSNERRANFVQLCKEHDIAVPIASDMGARGELLRYFFEDDSVVHGVVTKGSKLAEIQLLRGFYLGYKKPQVSIPISSISTPKGHISENNFCGNLELSNSELLADAKLDMSLRNELSIDTSVISFNNRTSIENLDISHTFFSRYGIQIRPKDDDIARLQIVDIRFVDALPPAKITSGELLPNFWYLVTYDTPDIASTGYVLVGGEKWYCGDSVLVKSGSTSLTIPAEFAGKVHLRECWHNDFANDKNPNNESKAFWDKQQIKPNWMAVVHDDLRAQFLRDNENTGTIKRDAAGNYITSGHPDFYPELVNGAPSFNLYGAFLQIRIKGYTGNEQ